MVNIKFIPKFREIDCWRCGGRGCSVCNGNGKWVEKFWIAVYENNKGKKFALGVDSIK